MDRPGSDTHPRPSLISTNSGGSSRINSLRSAQGMEGLLLAETGGGTVALDLFNRTTGFKEGVPIDRATMSPERPRHRPRFYSFDGRTPTNQRGTLPDYIIPPAATSRELKTILGNVHSKLKSGASISSSLAGETPGDKERLLLEQTKSHALAEVDVALESNICVQGSSLQGSLVINVLQHPKGYHIQITEPKIRVVGYEHVPSINERHVFYQESQSLSSLSSSWNLAFDSGFDDDGFSRAKTGLHIVPFSFFLPIAGTSGDSKGVFNSAGASTRYITMATTKVKDTETGRVSVAHFYRECEIWPRLDPTMTLQSAPRPIQVTASKSLFLGGSGTVKFTAALHRLYWISGQRCFVKAMVSNNTTRTLKSFNLTLIRRVTTFKPSATIDIGGRDDPDACQTNTIYKEVAQSTLEIAHRVLRGYAGSKGWWTGVNPGENATFSHCILIPPDALTVPRGRILEVEYNLRATISAGPLSSNVSVDVPIRIVNFASLDTPPSTADPNAIAGGAASLWLRYHAHPETRNHSTDEQLDGESFRLLRQSPGDSGQTTSSLAKVRPNHVDSDGEVDMVVRKASSQHPEATAPPVGIENSQTLGRNGQASIQALVYGQGRVRSKTISTISQSPSSFAKSAQDKLLRMESHSSLIATGMAPLSNFGPPDNTTNLSPSSSTESPQSTNHPSAPPPSSGSTSEDSTTGRAPSTAGRVQSAPARREEPLQDVRPSAWRSQSDTSLGSSPVKTGSDKPSDVRKRIEELEAKMRGNAK